MERLLLLDAKDYDEDMDVWARAAVRGIVFIGDKLLLLDDNKGEVSLPGGAVLHCPVYEITLNGETLRMEKEVYSNVGVPQIGESRTLYIDENDLDSYVEPIADKSARMIG
ncbi:hypothetical protein [Ruminococcus sp.]|uniref:hypothetical protein n=1 Tax=Ruminococcus sp. TaxID=41978 RepID=UPI0025E82B88|nr:hypothetical protein [Ruminococcus sp.]MBR1431823.1 hypothetical protein [Ruminococcus sp.]